VVEEDRSSVGHFSDHSSLHAAAAMIRRQLVEREMRVADCVSAVRSSHPNQLIRVLEFAASEILAGLHAARAASTMSKVICATASSSGVSIMGTVDDMMPVLTSTTSEVEVLPSDAEVSQPMVARYEGLDEWVEGQLQSRLRTPVA